jgi:hypothetical protein
LQAISGLGSYELRLVDSNRACRCDPWPLTRGNHQNPGQFGTKGVFTITNTRPMYPSDVTSGHTTYPPPDEILRRNEQVSPQCIVLRATDEAFRLGNPIYANVSLIGPLIAADVVPLDRESIVPILEGHFFHDLDADMKDFNRGMEIAREAFGRHDIA